MKLRLFPYLLGSLPGLVQLTTSLHRALHQLLPAALHAEQQVLDQHHVLFLAEVLQMRPRLVQFNDVVSVGVHLRHEHLQGGGKVHVSRRALVVKTRSFALGEGGNVIGLIDETERLNQMGTMKSALAQRQSPTVDFQK